MLVQCYKTSCSRIRHGYRLVQCYNEFKTILLLSKCCTQYSTSFYGGPFPEVRKALAHSSRSQCSLLTRRSSRIPNPRICVMNYTQLLYQPKWYHWGDAESIPFTLVYSVLSLSTIFLVEYISAAVLFSRVEGILISDAAALVAFSNSTWQEVFRWIFIKRPGRRAERRICKRSILALFLRVFVIVIDLAILGLSLPRTIAVYERDVGSTVMAFGDVPRNTTITLRLNYIAPCKPDPIQYQGFTPTATRKICVSSSLQPWAFPIDADFLAWLDIERNDAYLVTTSDENGALIATHLNTNVLYVFSHVMRIQNNTQYLLPSDPGIVGEFWRKLVKYHSGTCTERSKVNATSAFITCSKYLNGTARNPFNDSSDGIVYTFNGGIAPIHALFTIMETRPLKPGVLRRKVRDFNTSVPDGPFQVGTISRPRVCIIHALIMFFSFFSLACILRNTKGKQDIAFRLWSYICRSYGSYNTENPLFSDCEVFWKGTSMNP